MWIEHILQVNDKFQSKTPENHTDFLDLNLDLPFAKFMIEMLRPSVEFMKVEDYIKVDRVTNNNNQKVERSAPGFFLNHNTRANGRYNNDHWMGNITFKGIYDGHNNGPSPTQFRYYLQKIILDEINTEFFENPPPSHKQETLFNLLNRVIENTNSTKKITLLLNSISDIIKEELFENHININL